MHEVHIYIYADKFPVKEASRWYGYVLECRVADQSRTKEGFGQACTTYHGAVLTAMVKALERLNQTCEVHLHTEDEYVIHMLENRLDIWAGNGFMTAKGHAVANQTEWMQIRNLSQRQLILSELGEHTYTSWLKTEIKKRKEKRDV